jgi:hypothetical protein
LQPDSFSLSSEVSGAVVEMSMHRIEVNPLESGDVGTGVTLNMDNISGARLIDHSELQALMKKLNATVLVLFYSISNTENGLRFNI